jgi:putative hydrolase of the HAD superfamily
MNIQVIAFDADDTLWDNQPLFDKVEKNFCHLLAEYGSHEEISEALFAVEMQNMECYGYGAKAFTLSMIEAAITISRHLISTEKISQMVEMGKYLLNMPICLLDGVEDTLEQLNKKYKLVVATKGDLLDQQSKLQRSGIAGYFGHVEIMTDKTESEYNKLIASLNIEPQHILMVGNSLKSDIYPALAVGMYAAYVPYHTMWKHEVIDEKATNERFLKVDSLSQLAELI